MKNIIITLPKFLWESIVKGEKRYEIRKNLPRLFSTNDSKCYVIIKGTDIVAGYISITGFYSDIYKKENCSRIAKVACVPDEWVSKYLKESQRFWAWRVAKVCVFKKQISAKRVFSIKSNPQSYVYTDVSIDRPEKAVQ